MEIERNPLLKFQNSGLKWLLTPWKINMERKHGSLEDDFPVQKDGFQVPS